MEVSAADHTENQHLSRQLCEAFCSVTYKTWVNQKWAYKQLLYRSKLPQICFSVNGGPNQDRELYCIYLGGDRWRGKRLQFHHAGESLLSCISRLLKLKAVSSHGEIILDSQIILNTSARRQFANYFLDGLIRTEKKTHYHTEKHIKPECTKL